MNEQRQQAEAMRVLSNRQTYEQGPSHNPTQTDELRGIARLHAAGIIRPNTTQSFADNSSSKPIKLTSKEESFGVSNRIEELYQHYMKTQMKHYVPKKRSRENLLNNESRMISHTSNSFYDAQPFGGSYKSETVCHADQKSPDDAPIPQSIH